MKIITKTLDFWYQIVVSLLHQTTTLKLKAMKANEIVIRKSTEKVIEIEMYNDENNGYKRMTIQLTKEEAMILLDDIKNILK